MPASSAAGAIGERRAAAEVGIILHSASGKDIRRLIASGTAVTNQEKINQVVRMVLALDALRVPSVRILPDPTHMGERVMAQVAPDLRHTRLSLLELPFLRGSAVDTRLGTAVLREDGAGCIIVLGGDGTCRVVAGEAGDVPLLPVSTGTNNVFPRRIEGTLAGLAAGHIALGRVPLAVGCRRAPRLVLRDAAGATVDLALVDLAWLNAGDLGARAVWETDSIRELFLTSASPSSIGLSSIGGWVCPLDPNRPEALRVRLGPAGRTRVVAPLAPGLLCPVQVEDWQKFGTGQGLALQGPGVIALDGEREILVREGQTLWVWLEPAGPLVVDLEATLACAARLPEAERLLVTPPA